LITDEYLNELKLSALNVRKLMVENVVPDHVYHFGGSLSIVEILVYLYFHIMKNENLNKSLRHKVVLSKGHCCYALYAVLAQLNYISKEELGSYKQLNSILQGHPDMKRSSLIDFSSGSLGQGLSVSTGMALGYKMKQNDPYRVYAIVGDGELQEGQNWEAAMTAKKYKLNNLICIVDYNKLQVDGEVDQVMPLDRIDLKWKAFGWNVCQINGHDFRELENALEVCHLQKDSPSVIIAHTIKGKGVPFMENQYLWHSGSISAEKKNVALAELNKSKEEEMKL
jgi:transketolase